MPGHCRPEATGFKIGSAARKGITEAPPVLGAFIGDLTKFAK